MKPIRIAVAAMTVLLASCSLSPTEPQDGVAGSGNLTASQTSAGVAGSGN